MGTMREQAKKGPASPVVRDVYRDGRRGRRRERRKMGAVVGVGFQPGQRTTHLAAGAKKAQLVKVPEGRGGGLSEAEVGRAEPGRAGLHCRGPVPGQRWGLALPGNGLPSQSLVPGLRAAVPHC